MAKDNKTLTPAEDVEIFVVFLGAEHSNDLVVNVDPFDQHPAKRCAQKVVRSDRHDTTCNLVINNHTVGV